MDTQPHILLVDDDRELCELLAEYLASEGFTVSTVHTGSAALQKVKDAPDLRLIVLDIMMPGMSGLEVLQRLRPEHNIPVIMLTGRGDDIDRILGLEMGADDYLPKPCNPRELAARARAILRRSQHLPAADNLSLQAGAISLTPRDMQASANGEPLTLTAAEFNTLKLLMSQPGATLSKAYLTKMVLHRELTAYDRSIDVHVSRIRQKLAAHDIHDIIRSVRGVGYQLIIT